MGLAADLGTDTTVSILKLEFATAYPDSEYRVHLDDLERRMIEVAPQNITM